MAPPFVGEVLLRKVIIFIVLDLRIVHHQYNLLKYTSASVLTIREPVLLT